MRWVVKAKPRPTYTWERHGTHCVGSGVGSRAALKVATDLPTTGIRSLDLPAPSESLYRLSYLYRYHFDLHSFDLLQLCQKHF